jgi:hypothetical protein
MTAPLLALTVAAAFAQDGQTVTYTVDEATTDLGNLHMTVMGGVSLSAQERFFVGGTGFWEVTPNLAADFGAFVPVARVDSDLGPWLHVEGAVRLHTTSTQIEEEPIELSRSEDGSTRTVEYVNVPTATKSSKGVSLGLMSRQGYAKVSKEGSDRTDSFMVMPTIGISAVQAVGTKLDIEGYGKRSQFRWTGGGVDLIVDGVHRYEFDQTDDFTNYGFRLYNTAVFGRAGHPSLGGRLEMGFLPGGQGAYFMAGIGGGLNFGI